ncbi:hypothetical protein A2Y83_02255 [Candidatus Falkowbacteria bacterium RBG_13_39_14]|uniref:O-antigen ligase-related domain-containing protein n=1 Tax=Candidatus Falkowbacteria bacterium RBG_13_39_14 TaxID=1797985 RepID=A0A1F5S7Z3_9BACT|nr:MAG: hypothetical protein A2Y83_02255 [Candidatus Falkowbacteria bacterium RBG_13_39_14]
MLTPLLVFRSLLFPFITSKAFYFRIIIELLAAVYLLFIYQYPNYIPRKNALTAAIFIFSGIFVLTSFTGIDFNLSFWSDIERMEGAFGFLHLALYFIIIMTVFRSKEDWHKLLHIFWGVLIALCLYGLGQKIGINGLLLSGDVRISSTLGNSAYLGGMALFSISLSLLFFLKAKHLLLKISYALVLIFNLIILLFTGTRGAYLGFAAGIFLCLLLYAILMKNKKMRMVLAAILCFFILGGALLILNSEKPIVKENYYLYRLSHFSFKDATLNTRLISWKAGLRGFLERPVFGVGSGNYAYFFDKYFPPIFYSYTSSQTYFDHAHNTLVDIITTMGIFGILSYLAIWAIIVFYLISNFKENNIDLNEFVILASLLAAYFIQNIFVFDCLASFIAFFIFLGYIAYPIYNQSAVHFERENVKRKFNPGAACIVFAFSSFLIINYNLIPAKAMTESVRGQYEIIGNRDLVKGYELYKKSLSHGTVLDRDIRSSFINILISNGYAFFKSDKDKFLQGLDFAISLGEKNLSLNNEDTMMNLQLGQLYNLKGQATESGFDLSRGEFYLRKALSLSPGRLQIHFLLAQNRLLAGDKEEAVRILEKAKSLNSEYAECYTTLLKAYIYLGDHEKAYNLIWEAIAGKIGGFGEEENIYEATNYFMQKKEYDKLEVLYEWLLERDSENAFLMARLAAVYANLGKTEEAREMVNAAVELDPGLEEDGERFLEGLK